ncbi:MAG: helix-turn-helix domain-containing protein [Clostridiales Family XIII bacterium]|nr:helix-turn-helix domain-containing protein [Clostridiales Family XIII bacterium]
MNTYGSNSRTLKFKIVRLYNEDGISIKALSEKYGIAQQTIYGWCAQYREYGKDAFVGCGKRRKENAKIRRLQEENERLRKENEKLKEENERLQNA